MKNEELLVAHLHKEEALKAKTAADTDIADFESYIDMFDMFRLEKNYDWKSNISIPEFLSHILTQIALDVDQYFKSNDFVETYVQDPRNEAQVKAKAAKECVNRTLNQRHLRYYDKFVRSKLVATLTGKSFLRCWWEKDYKNVKIGTEEVEVEPDTTNLVDEIKEFAPKKIETRDVFEARPVIDRFNFDVIDNRNVFYSNEYTYTLQEKRFVYVREEKTVWQLKQESKSMGYVNLDRLGKIDPPKESETAAETYNKYEQKDLPNKAYDVWHRYGKYWAVVDEYDENEYPLKVSVGIDEEGNPLENAEFIDVFIAYAVSKNEKTLIRFQPNPYRDAAGQCYLPLIRGLCYLHPANDGGVGDGKGARELQIAIDDTFNVSNDRTLLATMPTMKGKKYALEDNSDVYLKPGHVIPLENPETDLVEMQFSDNTVGALNQMQMLAGKMDQVTSIYPPVMGQALGGSVTATATATASSNTNIRTNYKSMTYENTCLCDLYWMIIQMTNQFAELETGKKLMGELVYDFDPIAEYFYRPVSQAIEAEQSKAFKVRGWTQILGYIMPSGQPKPINYVLSKVYEYMGDEFANFQKGLLDETKPSLPQEAGDGGSEKPRTGGDIAPASNQNGATQTPEEQGVRYAG